MSYVKLPTLKLSADEEYLFDGSVRLYQNDTDYPMEVRFFRIVQHEELMPATVEPVYHMTLHPHHRTGVSRSALRDTEHYVIETHSACVVPLRLT